jgi:transcriptional regulator of NAD metabolism
MFDLSEIQIERMVVHKVGNKLREEGFVLSAAEYQLSDGNIEELLQKYFGHSFKEKVLYKFFHETDIHLNELYMYASAAFIDQSRFYDQSVNILKHLYEKSAHPQIKAGEFYCVYFTGCQVEDQVVDAIGIFKTENKENYLKIASSNNTFNIGVDQGISTKKLDKGAIIFNNESVDGYRVAVIDTVNKGNGEALYWKDEFLKLTDVHDDYFHTQHQVNLCRDFAENVYATVYQADKKDQVMFVNKAVAYLDKNSQFQLEDFVQKVVREPELIERFKEHKEMYEANQGFRPADNFSISGPAVKRAKRKLKSLIKLDTDIEIKVKSAADEEVETEYIERGYDREKGMHFYKVYFNQEE